MLQIRQILFIGQTFSLISWGMRREGIPFPFPFFRNKGTKKGNAQPSFHCQRWKLVRVAMRHKGKHTVTETWVKNPRMTEKKLAIAKQRYESVSRREETKLVKKF
jgi:hypothetical protein